MRRALGFVATVALTQTGCELLVHDRAAGTGGTSSSSTSASSGSTTTSSSSSSTGSATSSSSTTSSSTSTGSSSSSSGVGCGNGVKEGNEACDGLAGVPSSCSDVLGPGATGTVTCSKYCQLDVHACTAPNECGSTTGLQAGSPWPMDGRCPTGISRSPFVGPQTASVKWTKKICDQFTSHVMIAASGSLYGGCADGTLNALDPVAGAPKWTFTSLKDMSNPVAIDSAGDIQVAALDSNFYVFLPSTGVRQATKALPTAPQGSSALLPNGDSCFGGADGKIYCLDGSGNQTTSLLLDATMYAAVGPVAPDGTLYASAFDPGLAKDGVLYALTMGSPPTVKWQMPIGPATGAIIEPMAGALYLGGWDGKIRRVPATGGPATWTINPGDRDGVGALGADGTLYATGATFPSPTFHAINPDGSVRWNFAPNDYVAGVVVGADGLIYIGTGGNDGNVYALEPVAGAVVWQFQIGASRQEPNSIASDGTLYVTTSDGNLFAFGP